MDMDAKDKDSQNWPLLLTHHLKGIVTIHHASCYLFSTGRLGKLSHPPIKFFSPVVRVNGALSGIFPDGKNQEG